MLAHSSRWDCERTDSGVRMCLSQPEGVTWVASANKESGWGVLRDELSGRSSYHNKAGGDRVIAAMAQLPKFGPVVILAEKPSIFFIIPVWQRGAALTTPDIRKRETENKKQQLIKQLKN